MSDKLNNILFDLRISYSTRTRMSKVARMQTWNNAQDAYLGRDASSFLFFLFVSWSKDASIHTSKGCWVELVAGCHFGWNKVRQGWRLLSDLSKCFGLILSWDVTWRAKKLFSIHFLFLVQFLLFFSFQFFHSEITALTFAFLVFKNADRKSVV